MKHILLCALIFFPGVSFAGSYARIEDFTPRNHRAAVSITNDFLVLQATRGSCRTCAGQAADIRSVFESVNGADARHMMVDLDLWREDPAVRDLGWRRSPGVVVLHQGEIIFSAGERMNKEGLEKALRVFFPLEEGEERQ